MILGIALAILLLAAAPAAAATLPPEEVLLQLRRARIAGETGDRETQRRILESVASRHPEEIPAVLALMEFHRSLPSSSEVALQIRTTLRDLLLRPEGAAPVALLRRYAIDPAATDADLEFIAGLLVERTSSGRPDPAALRLLGGLQEYFGKLEEARATFGRALKMDPDPTLLGRCISLDMELERWDSALALFRSARLEAGSSLWRFTAIRIYSALGMVRELDVELLSLLGERTGVPGFALPALISAAFQLYDDGRQERAERLFRNLSARFPSNIELQAILATLFAGAEEQAARTAEIEELWRARDSPIDLVNEGASRLTAGDPHGALEILQRATSLLPDSELAWFNQGLAAAALQRNTEADAAFTRSIQVNPSFAPAFVQRGLVRLRAGRIDEAAADARRALKIEPGLKRPWFILSRCEEVRGNRKKASEHMRRYQGP